MIDRRVHDRVPVAFQLCVTVVANPEITAIGETQDISKAGISVFLAIPLAEGTVVRVDIADSVLYGFVAHSKEWRILSKRPFAASKSSSEPGAEGETYPERRFHTGIDIVEVAMGNSGLSQMLKAALEDTLPNVDMSSTPA